MAVTKLEANLHLKRFQVLEDGIEAETWTAAASQYRTISYCLIDS